MTKSKTQSIEEYEVLEEPFYLPLADEIKLFEAAADEHIPILLKGPTGTGKTRFVEYMNWRLRDRSAQTNRKLAATKFPLVTVACHEDLTAADLLGRFLLNSNKTEWVDGPLTRVVKHGGICYLDEIVEARKDTTVIIHSLTDHRRLLTLDKLGEVITAADDFLMVVSYNPGYQSMLKDMKHSTRQRFIAIEFEFPGEEQEAKIIEVESGIDTERAAMLAQLGAMIRQLKGNELDEGVSTRSLIHAARLIRKGVQPRRACQVAVSWSISDDKNIQKGLQETIKTVFP